MPGNPARTTQQRDLLDLAEWWWDEAARCGEIGADGLRRFAISQAIEFTRRAA